MPVRSTPEEIAQWAEALETTSYAAVARQFGVNHKTVRKYLPGKGDQSSKPASPEALANWEAALDEGYGFQHIGEMYGVSKQTVAKYFPGRGWTPEQARSHGTFMKHNNVKMRAVLQ